MAEVNTRFKQFFDSNTYHLRYSDLLQAFRLQPSGHPAESGIYVRCCYGRRASTGADFYRPLLSSIARMAQ
jgi:hypothetical protein